MNELLGRFYFRITSNGNLTGEFSNDRNNAVQTESADRFSDRPSDFKSPEAFLGEYHSTWIEGPPDFPMHAILVIAQNKPNPQIFELVWTGQNRNVIFRGQGMIAEGLLIGNYQMEQV